MSRAARRALTPLEVDEVKIYQEPNMEVSYPPGKYHIPPWEKENHLQKRRWMGYVSSVEGRSTSNTQSIPKRYTRWN